MKVMHMKEAGVGYNRYEMIQDQQDRRWMKVMYMNLKAARVA
jgi:hypothetical protein